MHFAATPVKFDSGEGISVAMLCCALRLLTVGQGKGERIRRRAGRERFFAELARSNVSESACCNRRSVSELAFPLR